MDQHDSAPAHRRKLGPVSRISRLLLAILMAFSAVNWASLGISGFSRTRTPTQAGVWILIGLAIYYGLYQTAASGFGRRWGIRTVGAFAVSLVGTAAAAVAAEGELWAAPLTWLLYGLVLWFLILAAAGAPISLVLGTPGCEFGALGELIQRLRGVAQPESAAMWCCLGLHRLDEWEARRADAREPDTSRSP